MTVCSRRAFLYGGSTAAAFVAARWSRSIAHLAETPPAQQLFAAPLAPFRTSLSVSPFTEAVLRSVELSDSTYTARSVPDTQRLFMRHGATEVYARIATRKVAPQGDIGEHGWARGLERARLARDLGLPFNPELGLWAEYGDGGNYQQPPDFSSYPDIQLPAPWLSLTLEQMLPPLRQYGAEVARQIQATGADVLIWDIGNEVESGIAGVTVRPLTATDEYRSPDRVDPAIGNVSAAQLMRMTEQQRIDWCSRHLWPYTGRLIAAVAEGIRSVVPAAMLSTHISPLGQRTPAVHLAFWKTLKEVGFLPDQFGFSYYPGVGKSHHGPSDAFEWFKETATALKSTFGRKVFIAEGGVASGIMPRPYDFNDQVESYPLSDAGQHDFTKDLIAWGHQSGCLAGFRPWAPDLCIGPGWAPMSWFTQVGKVATAKPVMPAFEQALPTLYARVGGGRGSDEEVVVSAWVSSGAARRVVVELRDGEHIVASRGPVSLDASPQNIQLRATRRGDFPKAALTLVIHDNAETLLTRHIHAV